MKKILPINDSEIEGIYPDNIFLHSICSSSLANGEELARVFVEGYDQNQWKLLTRNVKVDTSGELVTVSAKPNENIMVAYIYRDLAAEDQQTIEIEYQQYTFSWATVSLFIAEKEKIEDGEIIGIHNGKLKETRMEYGHYSESKLHLWLGESMLAAVEFQYSIIPLSLKVTINERMLCMYAKTGMDEWKEFRCLDLSNQKIDPEKLCIGVLVNMGERQWNEWKYTNFIQLYTPKDKFLPDYFYQIKKGDSDDLLNFFLEYSNEYVKNIESFSTSFVDYIRNHIIHCQYCRIGIVLEEKEIRRASSNKSLNQANLLYGFDDDKKVFYSMQVSMDTVTLVEFPFEQIEQYLKSAHEEEYIRCIQYRPSEGHYDLNIKWVIEFLKDYLSGMDSSKRYARLLGKQKHDYIYGIRIYDVILEGEWKEETMNLIATKVLYEHKKRMLDRMDYFCIHKIGPAEEMAVIRGKIVDIVRLAEQLLSCKRSDIEVRQIIMKMKTMEQVAYSELITVLLREIDCSN